jgi:hypothetical protein
MLLAAKDENGRPFQENHLRDEIVNLFLAGHETTANALSWTWYLVDSVSIFAFRFSARRVPNRCLVARRRSTSRRRPFVGRRHLRMRR